MKESRAVFCRSLAFLAVALPVVAVAQDAAPEALPPSSDSMGAVESSSESSSSAEPTQTSEAGGESMASAPSDAAPTESSSAEGGGLEGSPSPEMVQASEAGDEGATTAPGDAAPAASISADGVGPESSPTPETVQASEGSGEILQTIPVDVAHDQADAATGETETLTRGIGIEEIIVTAQKRSEDINEVPIAISAFSGDDLATLGVTDTQSLSRMVPGFSANENGGQSTIFTLRGVGFNDTTYTATGTVGIYVDEVNLPYSAMTRGPTVDVKRVEVLKGPQGTLYGRNTTGGLINYVPNEATDSFSTGMTAGYSRFETIDAEGFVSGPFTDTLKGRLAIRVIDAGKGWQVSNTRPNDTFAEQSRSSLRGSLDWAPTDNLTFKAGIEGFRIKGQPQGAQALDTQAQNPFVGAIALDPRVSSYPYYSGDNPRVADWAPDYPWRIKDSFLMESLKGIWNVSDTMAVTGIASHMKVQADGSDAATSGLDVLNTDSRLDASIKTDAFELRVSDQWGDRFNWTLGANLSKDVGTESRQIHIQTLSIFFPLPADEVVPLLPSNFVATEIVLNGAPTIKQKALFLNTDTNLTDVLDLNLGIRYTENDQHYTSCAYEPEDSPQPSGFSAVFTGLSFSTAAQYTLATGMPGNPSPVLRGDCFILFDDGSHPEYVADLNEDNLSGRAALSWKPDGDTLVFGSISRGFKAGGFPVLNASSTKQLVAATQEELLDYEAGTKISFLENKLHVDFGGFYYDYKDKQLLTRLNDPLFGPLPLLRNAPKSHVYGVELGIQATPIDGLFVAFAGSYIKTKIDEFVSTNFTGDEQDFAGQPFNFSPEAQASIVADYTWGLTQRLDLGVGADYSYTGRTNGTLEENAKYAIDSYSILGARVHLGPNSKTWTATMWGRNLTNELVNTGTFNLGDTVVRYTGMPRTYGVSFSYFYD